MSAIALPGWVATYGLAHLAEDFQEILAQRPEICEEISRVLAERVVALRAARENLAEQARVTMVANQHRSIRDRIERFFGLVD